MRATIYNGIGNIELKDLETPKAGSNDVVVKNMRAGICGTDIHAYTEEGESVGILPNNQFGHEMVGYVHEVGERVQGIQKGMRVFVNPITRKPQGKGLTPTQMCIDRLEMGDQPVCVMACRSRALDFGPIKSLREKYGTHRDLEDMPSSRLTHPAVVVKPKAEKKQLVPYDAKRAAELMMKRDPMPSIFDSTADILVIPEETIGRSALVLKHRTAAELLHHTRNDEG